jgi:hypothetical protein
MNQLPATERRKQVLKKRVVTQRPVANNRQKKESINTIISSASINSKKVTVEGNFFSNIDQIINDIKSLTTNIKIDSYFEVNINYNSDESIKSLFNEFIEYIKNIEIKKKELENYTGTIDTKIKDININLNELQNVITTLLQFGNKNANANVRNAVQKVKPTIDNNKRLLIELKNYQTKVSNEVEDSETMIVNLKSDFKEKLYNNIVTHYNSLIRKGPINLSINQNTIINDLITLKKNIEDGETYLQSINKNIKLNLGNNNYNLESNILYEINKKIKVISDRLNELKVSMTNAIEKLKTKTTENVKVIKNSITTNTEKLIKAIKDCISRIKTNKNTILNKIKTKLELLKNKFGDEIFNFKNIFPKNNNVIASERKLNSILSGIESLFSNKRSIDQRAGEEGKKGNGKNNRTLTNAMALVKSGALGINLFNENVGNNSGGINKPTTSGIGSSELGKKNSNIPNSNNENVKNQYRNISNNNRNNLKIFIKNGTNISWIANDKTIHTGKIASHDFGGRSGQSKLYKLKNIKNQSGKLISGEASRFETQLKNLKIKKSN